MKKWLIVLLSIVMLQGCSIFPSGETNDDQENYVCRVIDTYNYMDPVPQSQKEADDSFYEDALFAGDSRMGSLALYGRHRNAEVAYVTSLNLLRIDSMPVDERDDKKTLMEVLQETNKKHIYLLFGINEIRNPNFDLFADKYQEIITMLKEHNPKAQIYLILSYHPGKISGLTDEQLDHQLNMLNSKIKELAQKNHVYYLDVDGPLVGENGKIKDDYVFDGLHFNPKGAHVFEDYLGNHIVGGDEYVKEICE